MPEKLRVNFYDLIEAAHELNMNVRACLNLTDEMYKSFYAVGQYFEWANTWKIEQLTFRKIYESNNSCGQNAWIKEHKYPEDKANSIDRYIECYGTPIAKLPFGYVQFSVGGISTVVDNNCMSKNEIDNFKYMILRPNGHLYSRWDDKGSLVF
jgi:hypothetical protein